MSAAEPVAVVTGAGSGIGAATVRALGRNGYRVACFDLNEANAARVAAEAGDGHRAYRVNVGDEADVIAAFEAVAADFGRLDALATCAGVVDTTPFMEVSVETFRRVHDINVIGTFLSIREAARTMPRGSRICTIASVAGIRGGGLSGTAAYAASKGAVLALTKNAARALADRGISVNTVAPGSTRTPMIDRTIQDPVQRGRIEGLIAQGRVGEPEEIAEAIAWLLSPRASYINGSTLVADGGMVML
ncbi:MAG TPA: SDR family oxidoreductase [Stellaceae bacterium]|nr:SDR family oxidoreductase [Stellaceae bacterium]